MDRIPASERTREKLKALMEGRGEVEDGRSELVRLAARLIIGEALEGEGSDAVGRGYYALRQARQRLSQRLPVGPGEECAGGDRVQRAADCRPSHAVPLAGRRVRKRDSRRCRDGASPSAVVVDCPCLSCACGRPRR